MLEAVSGPSATYTGLPSTPRSTIPALPCSKQTNKSGFSLNRLSKIFAIKQIYILFQLLVFCVPL